MDKENAYKFFTNLNSFLTDKLSQKKESIIEQVKRVTPPGKETEGNFIKIFLAPLLKEYFSDRAEGVIIEGINSRGRAQFKNTFLGSKPAPDFIFSSPLPFNTVGEVKYGPLSTRFFATALGQLIVYIKSSELEQERFDYGYMIFFNTSLKQNLQEKEREFVKDIWSKENIFVSII